MHKLNTRTNLSPGSGSIGRSYYLFFPVAYMGLIYYLSSVPGAGFAADDAYVTSFAWIHPGFQNVLHVPAYALLAILWGWSLNVCDIKPRALILLTFFLTAGYGLFDEWHQSWVPGRVPSTTDWVANTIGAFIGTWLTAPVLLREVAESSSSSEKEISSLMTNRDTD